MSKVVILAINAKYVHSSLAVRLLAESVSQYALLPHDVAVTEANINQDDNDIAGQVAAYKPDIVGISTYIWNAKKLPNIIEELRKLLPKAIVVLGGPEASHNAAYWIDRGVDFVLRGEGERSFPTLLDTLESGAAPEYVPGLCWRQGNEIRCKPEAEVSNDFIDPFNETCLAAIKGKIVYIEASRGCPFRCAFCLSGNRAVKFFPLDMVKEQLAKLSKADVRIVKFVDRTFNCDAKRAYEMFDYIIGLDTPNCFHVEVAADLFDERTLQLLATAPPGRIQIEAGLQSFFEPTLEAICRKTNLAKAVKNIRTILRSGNIHVHADLIAGLPHETLSDFQNSFDKAYAIGAHTLQLGFLKMLHGSELRENEKSIIFAEEPPYEIISSPWMSVSDLEILKRTESALQHTYNKGRFLSTLQYVLSAAELRPFSLYHALGEVVSASGLPLGDYAAQLYIFCKELRGVEQDKLLECMICDWLGMVKGANMPQFLKIADKQQLAQITETAEVILGRKLRRNETAVLPSGKGVYVDSEKRDAVTGLYAVVCI